MELNDLTYQINGAVFEVNRVLGAGFLEKVYEQALLIELSERGLKAKNQVSITVNYKGQIIGEYFADIVVEDSCASVAQKAFVVPAIPFQEKTKHVSSYR